VFVWACVCACLCVTLSWERCLFKISVIVSDDRRGQTIWFFLFVSGSRGKARPRGLLQGGRNDRECPALFSRSPSPRSASVDPRIGCGEAPTRLRCLMQRCLARSTPARLKVLSYCRTVTPARCARYKIPRGLLLLLLFCCSCSVVSDECSAENAANTWCCLARV